MYPSARAPHRLLQPCHMYSIFLIACKDVQLRCTYRCAYVQCVVCECAVVYMLAEWLSSFFLFFKIDFGRIRYAAYSLAAAGAHGWSTQLGHTAGAHSWSTQLEGFQLTTCLLEVARMQLNMRAAPARAYTYTPTYVRKCTIAEYFTPLQTQRQNIFPSANLAFPFSPLLSHLLMKCTYPKGKMLF